MIASLRALWHSLSLSKQFAIVAVMVLLPGMAVTGWPVATVVRGRIVMRDGALIGAPAGRE